MVSEKKKSSVLELATEIEKWPVIALVDMVRLPAAQLQDIRASLYEKARIKMMKKSTIKLALAKSKKENVPQLAEICNEATEPALILSKDDPFKIYNVLREMRRDAFAKVGEIASADIAIKAGKTSLPPGPLVSELQKVGLKAAIQGPVIAILEDKILVKAGEKITKEKAEIMQKLGIKPGITALKIVAAYDKGLLFTHDALKIMDIDFTLKIAEVWQASFNLAYNADYLIAETLPLKIAEAARTGMALKSLLPS